MNYSRLLFEFEVGMDRKVQLVVLRPAKNWCFVHLNAIKDLRHRAPVPPGRVFIGTLATAQQGMGVESSWFHSQ